MFKEMCCADRNTKNAFSYAKLCINGAEANSNKSELLLPSATWNKSDTQTIWETPQKEPFTESFVLNNTGFHERFLKEAATPQHTPPAITVHHFPQIAVSAHRRGLIFHGQRTGEAKTQPRSGQRNQRAKAAETRELLVSGGTLIRSADRSAAGPPIASGVARASNPP